MIQKKAKEMASLCKTKQYFLSFCFQAQSCLTPKGIHHVPDTSKPAKDIVRQHLLLPLQVYLIKQQQLGNPKLEGFPKLVLTHSAYRTEVALQLMRRTGQSSPNLTIMVSQAILPSDSKRNGKLHSV